MLRGIKERVAVIAVAGKYRTGKSFLLNRILLDKKDANGFGVGPTINPCTKVLLNSYFNLTNKMDYSPKYRDYGYGVNQ